MKKNRRTRFFLNRSMAKWCLHGCLVMGIVLGFCRQGVAQGSKALVSLSVKQKTIGEILKEIEKQVAYKFMYHDSDLMSFGRRDLSLKQVALTVALDSCLRGTSLGYEFVGDQIILKRIKKQASARSGKTISGNVKDQKGNTLPGVAVLIEGTTVGVVTDIDGNYSLLCPQMDDLILVFSYLGMKPQRQIVGSRTGINVVLEEDVNRLDEVVAVGYGTKKVKDMTGAVSRLTSKDMETVPMGSTLQSMLQGRAAGVNVMISSASPTSPVSVVIRGNSSLTGDGQPLWVIDGVPQYDAETSGNVTNTLYNLNLNDVECVDILKDASATAIYGSRAANGVVLVTTKRGAAGMKPQLEFSARYGIQKMHSNNFRVLTAEEYIRYSKAAVRMGIYTTGNLDYFTSQFIDKAYFEKMMNNSHIDLETITDDFFKEDAYYEGRTDWWKLMTQNASTQDYSLSLRGGSQSCFYNASVFYKDQKGVVKGGNSKLVGGNFNFDAAIREVLRFKMNLKASSRVTNDKDNMIEKILYMRPDVPAYTEDGEINLIDYFTENPLITRLNRNEAKGKEFAGTLGLEWDILEGLTLKTTGTASYSHSKTDVYERKYYEDAQSSRTIAEREAYTYIWDNTLNYNRTFGNHNIIGLLGFSIEKFEDEFLEGKGTDFPDDEVLIDMGSASWYDYLGSGYSANTLLGAFARLDYKFKNRYLLTGNFRADASSKFGPDKRWGYFPSGAVAWIVSEENFLKEYENIISYLKIRFSIGKTGSQNLGNYSWRTLMGSGTYNGRPGLKPSSLGNDVLQWESQTQKEVGLDYGFWYDRVRGSLGWYQKSVDNLLYNESIPWSSAFRAVTRNIGAIRNRGVEFDIKVDILQNRQYDLNWNVDFNIARNVCKVMKLNNFEKYVGGSTQDCFKIEEGAETGTFYGYKYAGRLFQNNEEVVALKPIDPETGKQLNYRDKSGYEQQGDLYIMDLDGDGKITPEGDRTIIGNANPDFFGGFGTTVLWKGLMLNAVFSYAVGGERYWNQEQLSAGDINTMNTSSNVLDSWTMNPGVNIGFPRTMYYGYGGNSMITDRYIHDASYLRMSALNLNYRLPKSLLGNSIVDAVDFSFQVTNLFTWTKYPGMDPQGNFRAGDRSLYAMGVDYSTYPSARTFNFGIKITLK